jgi:hypothetical protein
LATGEPSGTTRTVLDASVGGAAGHGRHFVGAALLDRNLPDAVVDTKVDGGDGSAT